MSLEVVQELYKARAFYSNQGIRNDLVPNGTKLISFEKYLNYVGLSKRTSYNWFERYIPEENKLLTFEELQQKKQIEIESKKSQEQKEKEFKIKQMKDEEKEFQRFYDSNVIPSFDDKDKQDRYLRYKKLQDFIQEGYDNQKKKQDQKEQEKINIDDLLNEGKKYVEQENGKIKSKKTI